jgi:DNA-binding transcriptional regulator YhcF (GntR family)
VNCRSSIPLYRASHSVPFCNLPLDHFDGRFAMRSQGWADLYEWGLDRTAGAPPLFRQIYVQVRAAILSGALTPGTKLPSSRAMANRLRAARASVVVAYEQLLTEGYLVARAGSGTFVSSDLAELIKLPKRHGGAARENFWPTLPIVDFERAQAHSRACRLTLAEL